MQLIQPPSGNILKILGKPKPSETSFRWMTYVLSKQVEGGVLLFHVLTREMLLLTPEEYVAPECLVALRDKWFLVPEGLNDRKYADQARFVYKTMQKKSEHITKYTIFTTTDCNARCFYCYEMGRKRIPMSESVARKAAAYMAKHCGDEKKIRLSWFGGEPLFNKEVIDIIIKELAEQGIAYSSNIISNGYLFDVETVQKAVKCWNLKWVQIAMDGTEEVYNRSKAYIYKDGLSPYQVVMENIGHLLDAGVKVFIRLNMDNHNAENLFDLVDELHERFAGRENLTAYSHMLFSFAGAKEQERTTEERQKLFLQRQHLREKLIDYGMWQTHTLKKNISIGRCMADSGDALTILPNGDLGLCEHYSDDNYVGHIDSEELDRTMVQSFKEQWPATQACEKCFYYPQCIRLKKCEEERECFLEMREEQRQNLLEGMQQVYEEWVKQKI